MVIQQKKHHKLAFSVVFWAHDKCNRSAKVAELVDALDLGSSGATRESSSLSFRTISHQEA